MKQKINLKVNGQQYTFEVDQSETLLEVLRGNLKLNKTKEGCGVGECGSCAVIMNKKAINSCLVLAVDADGKEILTAEGMADDMEYHPFNEALIGQGSTRASFEPPGSRSQQEFFTFCHVCPGHCSVKATVEEGKVVDIVPDKESGLPNELCPVKKGRFSIPEVLHHPDRLQYPQKRVGARGEGKWERISWDEALDTIAKKLLSLKEQYGPESVAFGLGEPKGLEFAFAQRFATAFGTPNVVTPGWCCGIPSGMASALTYGWNCVPDEEHPPRLMVLWAINNNHTSGGIRRETFERALESGAKLIVVDPRKIDVASIADLWVRPRPTSDGALAMGLLKAIVEEKLYDKEFVDAWCDQRPAERIRGMEGGDPNTLARRLPSMFKRSNTRVRRLPTERTTVHPRFYLRSPEIHLRPAEPVACIPGTDLARDSTTDQAGRKHRSLGSHEQAC